MTGQRHEFQAETRQLLRLMIHSLYSNKEIFLRELISNASDAADKLRFNAIQTPELLQDDAELAIELIPDAAQGTLTIRDNGIGMSQQDVIDNLGTIARSGTKQFLESMPKEGRDASQLIGQFGVGFYSSFIVADKVTVRTRLAGSGDAVQWESDGAGEYTIESCDKATRGTDVILHLREDDKEFLEPERLRHLVRKYSDHIGLPVQLVTQDGKTTETLNRAAALWTRSKSEITDTEYQQFYTHLTHDPQPPLAWTHQRVEGNQSYTSLLYLPSHAPHDLWDRDRKRGVNLYVKRVFIMDDATSLLPAYLRFMRGLVDSDDLPLNVSRELLQGSRAIDKIRSALVKRSLDMLEDLAKNRPDDYAKFWDAFGLVLKEGVIEDLPNRERIAGLCRFRTSAEPDAAKTGLADYVAAMPAEQTSIYYVTADSPAAARNSPLLEGLKARGWNALLLTDRIDEWLTMHLGTFAEKPLMAAASVEAIPKPAIETPESTALAAEYEQVLKNIDTTLAGKISGSRLSQGRLTESPACLVDSGFGPSRRLQKIAREAGEFASLSLPSLEINPDHPLVARLRDTPMGGGFEDLATLLYEQAQLAEGSQLDDPVAFVKRLNTLILGDTTPRGKIILGV